MDSAPNVTLPNIGFVTFLPTDALIPLIFLVIVFFYAIFTGVFYYHWNAYAMGGKVISLTYLIYFVLTVPLLAIMATVVLVS